MPPGHYGYYICSGKAKPVQNRREDKCPSRFIPAEQLDELVWHDLCEVLTHPQSIAQALERAQGGQWLPQELQARLENLRRGRVSLEHQLDRLTEAYMTEVIPLAEYQRRRRELEERSQGLQNQAQQLTAQVDQQKELAGLVSSIEDFCQRVQQGLETATFEQKRQLIELLIDRVVVTDGDVEIRYVIPTSPNSEHVRFCHLRTDYFGDPHLVRMIDDQVLHPVRVARKGMLALRRPVRFAPVFPSQSHRSHDPAPAFGIHDLIVAADLCRDTPHAVGRPGAADSANLLTQAGLRARMSRIVVTTARQVDELAEPLHRLSRREFHHDRPFLLRGAAQSLETFFAASSSRVRRPTSCSNSAMCAWVPSASASR